MKGSSKADGKAKSVVIATFRGAYPPYWAYVVPARVSISKK
jgi:hypothetical protein